MRLSTAIAASVLAVISSVSAAPAQPKATFDKPFKLAITPKTAKGKDAATVYLTASGTSTKSGEAVECTINSSTKLSCGGLGLDYGDAHTDTPLMLTRKVSKSVGFSIDESGVINWNTPAGKKVNFSTHSNDLTKVYAEICNSEGHLDGKALPVLGFIPGVAKAVFA